MSKRAFFTVSSTAISLIFLGASACTSHDGVPVTRDASATNPLDARVDAMRDGASHDHSSPPDAHAASPDAMVDSPIHDAEDGSYDVDVRAIPYWQWWYPQCGEPGTACTNPSCYSVSAYIYSPNACNGVTATFGCIPGDTVSSGDGCFASGTAFIVLQVAPYTMQGLTWCAIDGGQVGPPNGAPIPCADGGFVGDAW